MHDRFEQALSMIRHQIQALEHSNRSWREEQLYHDWRAREQWLRQHGSSIRGRGYATQEEMDYMNSVLRSGR